jgi:hypothetical protein
VEEPVSDGSFSSTFSPLEESSECLTVVMAQIPAFSSNLASVISNPSYNDEPTSAARRTRYSSAISRLIAYVLHPVTEP